MHTDLSAQYRAYFNTYINEIERLTALCGAHAIDSVMGDEWFSAFKSQEISLDFKFSTVQASHESILKNDFQGIIKIFRFREEEADIKNIPSPILITPVFTAFNLPRKERGKSAFSALCDTLIANRNHIHHLGIDAANTDNASELKSNISYLKKSILDCITFLQYFKNIVNENGVTYLDAVYRINEELESSYKIVRYHTLAVIRNERLDVTPERFSEICRELHITTFVKKETHYFESNDYEGDLRAVKAVIKSSAVTKKNILPAVISVAAAATVLLILLIILFS